MVRVLCIASLALAAVSAVSGHVIRHRRGVPKGWDTSLLQDYPEYHERYLSWDCQNKHNTTFFDTCCHALLKHESIDVLTKAGCDSDCDDGESSVTPSSSLPSTYTTPSANPVLAPASSSSPLPTTSSAKFRKVPASSSAPAPAPAEATSTPVTTSTREAAPSPSPSPSPTSSGNSDNNGGDNGPFTGGVATFFYQGGAAGACGQVHQDSDFICAMDSALYGDGSNNSPLCGKKVIITNTQNGKTVTVTVADECPTCENKFSIDLSVAAFDAIANESEGEVPISWVYGN